MINVESLISSMRRAFEGDAEGELTRALLEFLIAHPSTNHITLQLMRQIVVAHGQIPKDLSIVRTLQYLSGPNAKLLDTKFEILLDNDLEPVLLTEEEVSDATKTKINPVSGEYDAEIEKKVAIFFCPTTLVKEFIASSPNKGDK